MRIVGRIVGPLCLIALVACAKGGNGNENETADAALPPPPDAQPTLGQIGDSCEQTTDCADIGLVCADGVCCTSPCAGECNSCALPGSEGTCMLVPDGQDPDEECGAVTCSGQYHGWEGNSCHARQDVSAAAATCNGAGACRGVEEECASAGLGPAEITCDDACKPPRLDTCTGTTAGACTAGPPSAPETCNGNDDDCNGVIDDGLSADIYEPNDSCSQYSTITLGSSGSGQYYVLDPEGSLYPSGDVDQFRIVGTETDSNCWNCDGAGQDE